MIALVEGIKQRHPVAGAHHAAVPDSTALENATRVIARHLRAGTAASADPVDNSSTQQEPGCGTNGDSQSCTGASRIRDLQLLAKRALGIHV